MADKLYGYWTFDKAIFQPNGYRVGTGFSVNFTCNEKEFSGIDFTVPDNIDTLYTSSKTIAVYFSGEGGVHLYNPDTATYYPENKTIFITSKYDELNPSSAEKLLQALRQRATHTPIGDIEIPIATAKGVLLKTLKKQCENDIKIIPETEEISITENGEYVPSKVGYSKVIVNVASSGDNDKYFAECYETVDLPSVTKIKSFCFYRDKIIKTINMPKVTSIGDSAFNDCTNLAPTELPSGLTKIGSSAFCYCTNLALTELPSGVTEIDTLAFQDCTNLALTKLPSGLTEIGSSAFVRCTSLALTELPSGLTEIGSSAFSGCTKIALTELPSGLTKIDGGVFQRCTKIALTELPSGLTEIGNSAFYNCAKIALTELPSGLTKIGSSAFYNCAENALTELPSGLTEIGSSAFQHNRGLTALTFKGTPSSIASNAFSGCTNITTINVPWAEGAVANAPWGATNATINYNYTGE